LTRAPRASITDETPPRGEVASAPALGEPSAASASSAPAPASTPLARSIAACTSSYEKTSPLPMSGKKPLGGSPPSLAAGGRANGCCCAMPAHVLMYSQSAER
jgi:hypothetical protein